MNENWEKVKLKNIFSKINGLWTGKKEPFVEVKVYTMTNFTKDSFLNKDKEPREIVASLSQFEKRKLQKGDILVEKSGGGPNQPVGRAVLFDIDNDENNTFSNFTTRLRINENFTDKVYPNFVHHFLRLKYIDGETEKFQKNSTNIRNLQLDEYLEQSFCFPPLPEQQRIVSILDECFSAIERSRNNAEQNLKNAKELFQSKLQAIFDNGKLKVENGEWVEKKIKELGKVQTGSTPTTKDKSNYGNYIPFAKPPHFKPNGDIDTGDSMLSQQGVKKGRVFCENSILMVCIGATIGKTGFSEQKISSNQQINGLTPLKNYYARFFYYAFISNPTQKQVLKYGKSAQATLPIINKTKWENILVPFPKSKEEQQAIVRQLDALRAETQKLEAVYQQKMDDLEELKKSILQKAFAGELTSSVSISVAYTKVIPLQKVEGISPTDLQAGITAFALRKHIEQNQLRSFHHVKAEKIVHLSEYILNIDLDRNPVKDAAGPNDFPHVKKVESRARKAGFYTVYKNGEYYNYNQGNSFNKVIQKTRNCLKEKADVLSQIIDLLTPMSTQQAEIVATVYAAWNNLILNANQFSDEDIVVEARENWHINKLAIERNNFFKALEWMKKYELLVPKGNGKLVESIKKK